MKTKDSWDSTHENMRYTYDLNKDSVVLHTNITSELKKSHNLVFESMWNWSFFTKK